jgi:hypothetical protein
MQVAKYIEDEAKRIAQRDEAREIIQKTLGEWQLKAAKYINRTPISVKTWHDIVEAINADGNRINKVQNEWSPAHGQVQWVDTTTINAAQKCAGIEQTLIPDVMSHASWNVNGIRPRYRSGELIEFISRYKPTTLNIKEIKTDIAGIESPWELQHMLHALRYVHCVWSWCTAELKNTKRTSGNFGSAVFSKLPLIKVEFGMSLDNNELDKEGRVITASVGNDTFIWCYTPCSRFTEEEPRSQMRKQFDKEMYAHYSKQLRSAVVTFMFSVT